MVFYDRGFDGQCLIKASTYTVDFWPHRAMALLKHLDGIYYGMGLLSAVNSIREVDRSLGLPTIRLVRQQEDEVVLAVDSASSLWASKTHYYSFFEDRIDYWTQVKGLGEIDRAYYFQGWLGDMPLASVPGFHRIFHPQPNFFERQEFAVNEHVRFAVGHDDWVIQNVRGNGLHGSPLCWVFEDHGCPTLVSAALLVRTGEYGFDAVDINYLDPSLMGNRDHLIGTQAISIEYNGHQKVDGDWRSPTLRFRFGSNRFSLLKQYVDDLRGFGGMYDRHRSYPRWTGRPVYCTWHDQVALSQSPEPLLTTVNPSCKPFGYCTQSMCEHWLGMFDEKKIDVGTFIIDATWQLHSGEAWVDTVKFPDLRGFVDRCHQRDIRVMLWAMAWDRSGIPDQECLTKDNLPVAADPTHPAYQKRLADMVHRMLSDEPGCYNADGIKLDGMTMTPHGRGLKSHDGTAGFELARRLFALWSENVVASKEDAVLGLFTAFPYFADLVDMARTGDLYTVKGDPLSANRFRVQMTRLVMPDVSIDTDGAQRFNCVLPYEQIIRANRSLGVPCLYEIQWLTQRREFLMPQLQELKPEHHQFLSGFLKGPESLSGNHSEKKLAAPDCFA